MISFRCQIRVCPVLVLAVVLLDAAFGQSQHRRDYDTLAIIGTRVITVGTFTERYRERVLRFGLTDNGGTRQGYLRNLVDDEILITQAKNEKLDRTKGALIELSRLQLQALLNAYSEKHIASTIEVTEEDLKDLFLKMNTKIAARHLFARTKAEADSLYAELTRGKSFSELAQRVFTDSRLKEHGGSLGYFSIDEMDPDFEKAAFGMRIGEISRPVKTVEGYSIIQVDDIKRNPLLTDSEFLKAKERLGALVRKRKYEDAVKEHSARLRSSLHIRFDDTLITRLYAMTQQRSLGDLIENKLLSLSKRDRQKAVVSSTMGEWNVSHLFNLLSQTREQQRTWIRTKENFEDLIAGLVIRNRIAEDARKEKLDATASYRAKVQYDFDTFLLTTVEGQLKGQIKFSSDSIRSYYGHNRDRFADPPQIRLSAILLDNAVLADSIRRLLEGGAAFGDLAQRFSTQRLTSERGGDLGYYHKEELGTLAQEVFALKAGQWKGPIVEERKYLFLKCTEFKERTYRPFDECSKEVEDVLVSLAWLDTRSRYVRSLEKAIPCQLHPERLADVSLTSSNQ